jgi:hypothetical protein
MIYAVKHNKVNRAIYKANEDALTSSIFERFMYLPKDLFQYILKEALQDVVANLDLHTIVNIEYWPNWNPEHTTNKNRVEPDVFIRTATQDIIIEAKRYDAKQQSKTQWENEIQAYINEYSEDGKPLIFIALGGLHNQHTETIKVKNQQYQVYKCKWQAILQAINNLKYMLELTKGMLNTNEAILNILEDMIISFGLFGFSTADWLERFIPPSHIKKATINQLAL